MRLSALSSFGPGPVLPLMGYALMLLVVSSLRGRGSGSAVIEALIEQENTQKIPPTATFYNCVRKINI